MKKLFLLIILYCSITLFGQTNSDCFKKAKEKHDSEIRKFSSKQAYKDTANFQAFLLIAKEAKESVIGCKYPNTPFKNVSDKIIVTDLIKSNFIIINFNYLYDDNSAKQLDDLDSIKKLLKNRITIISLFAYDTKDIQHLVDKYGKHIEFIPNSDEYIKYYNLGLGTPLTYVIDEKKIIKYVSSGGNPKAWFLLNELIPYLK